MIVIIASSIVIGLVLVVAVAFVAGRVEVENSSSSTLGTMFMAPHPLDRPRGVQEEDLPRFVFRDQPHANAAR